MRKYYIILLLLLPISVIADAQTTNMSRSVAPFDKDWLFFKGDAAGADKTTFADADWRKVDVPHDWMIEGPYDSANPTGRGGGYLPAGIGWYRKHFEVDAAYAQKKLSIEFDGVMANSDVWINGYHLGKRPYGYITFNYDMTSHLNYGKGKTNVIAVRADNTLQPASRYYTGAGIYRHVRLIVTDPVHIDTWGVFISTPKITANQATVHVKTTIINSGTAAKTISVKSAFSFEGKFLKPVSGSDANATIAGGKTSTVEQDYVISDPKLWSNKTPLLYAANTQVISGGKIIDDKVTMFGIRDIKFTADQGFVLNGKKVMIKGVCLHHDIGALGAAVPLGAWQRRLQLLKDIGVNGIRTSHNPVAPEFLDLCDRMGFFVMDESFDTWEANKVAKTGGGGYNLYFKEWGLIDQRDQVMRDRNHPSVMIYSVGNEIHDNLDDSTGFKKYRDLQNTCHANDPTRMVTMAILRPASSKVYVNGFAKMMDVVGQNYRENELTAAHEAHPDWKVIGTENGLTQQAWLGMRDYPFVAGQFLWVGVDYLGESDWPNVTNGQGVIDRTGGSRAVTFQRDSWWSEKPVVHIVRRGDGGERAPLVTDWSPADDTYKDARVTIYSNCDEVELFLNGKSLGSKPKPTNDSPRDWAMPYEKGTIKAVGKNGGKEVCSDELKTAGAPAKILLTIDHNKMGNTWDDVAYVTASVVDANGILCPLADNTVNFSLTGPGVIAATDNGNLANHEIFNTPVRQSYHGKSIAIIKGNGSGKVTVKAASAGIADGSVSVEIVK